MHIHAFKEISFKFRLFFLVLIVVDVVAALGSETEHKELRVIGFD